ncbi:hypothetical protein CLV84_4313 [Neolewinella xylanilytica]|uniref:Uncharacterized protein n=1 Tax=Neolewinella xylanilytica TaxID=1514080 RepID=A0A2S6HZS8_9BACT|nr:hypothetical protein [Neolewinella xylanilytica]PPK83940.1 hypothetical protein CLV84_4313 [Neolewinella xylanilytica]
MTIDFIERSPELEAKIGYIREHVPDMCDSNELLIIDTLTYFGNDELAVVNAHKEVEKMAELASDQARLKYLMNFGVASLECVKKPLEVFFKGDLIEIYKTITVSITKGMDAYEGVWINEWYNPQLEELCGPDAVMPTKGRVRSGGS